MSPKRRRFTDYAMKFFKYLGGNLFNILSIASAGATLYTFYQGYFAFAKILVLIFVFALLKSIYDFVKRRREKEETEDTTSFPSLDIDGETDELLTLAEVNRTRTNNVDIQKAEHIFIVEKRTLYVTFRYSGKCISKSGADGMTYVICGDNRVPLSELQCRGYDLKKDPEKRYPIIPILRSSDGLCKKIKIPFQTRLQYKEEYFVEMTYIWPNCMRYGEDNIDSSLSFKKTHLKDYVVRIEFIENQPDWVRVYRMNKKRKEMIYEKTLQVDKTDNNRYIYIDYVDAPNAQSVRVYKFFRRGSMS